MSNVAPAAPRQAGKGSAQNAASTTSSPEQRAAALLFLQGLAGELSGRSINLPCFPDVVIRIRKALADPRAKASETVKIVGTEPRLAARLLQAANSAAFNPSGKPLTDLRAAITRLGHRAVQSSAMAFAVQQLRQAPALRSIASSLHALWEESIAVASICQVLARRTSVGPDEAFLTGLLHGIGRLYIMVRAVGKSHDLLADPGFLAMVDGWHAAIGKAVLENWGFTEAMSEAVGLQGEYDLGRKSAADLTDVLVVGVELALMLRQPGRRTLAKDEIPSFQRLRLTAQDCADILKHTEYQLDSLHDTLGC